MAQRMEKETAMSKVDISLTPDEAVVLFEFVRRFSDSEILTIADQAEVRALWNLCCVFEKSGVPWAGDDWSETVRQGRDRLRDKN